MKTLFTHCCSIQIPGIILWKGTGDDEMMLSLGSICLSWQIVNWPCHCWPVFFFSLPCRSWQLLSCPIQCSGPLACSSIRPSLAATYPALTPSSLSTVPTSRLPEILPGMVKRLGCCPGRLGELPGGSTVAVIGSLSCFSQPCVSPTQLSAWGDKRNMAEWSPLRSCYWAWKCWVAHGGI